MDSKELAKQIMSSCSDMDYLDYVEMYNEELDALTDEINKAKEMKLNYLLAALVNLSL